jgi:O-antigen biosynthesis protein
MEKSLTHRQIIEESGLFDKAFYLRSRPDVAHTGVDAIDHYLAEGWTEHTDPSERFSTEFYLRMNEDVRTAAINPLLHYILWGKQEGRPCSPRKAPRPHAPSRAEWEALETNYLDQVAAAEVDVLVPVYGGYDETMRCLYSVLRSRQATPFRLLVVNDASPEGILVDELNQLFSKGLIDLRTLPENLGFVGACNIGMSDSPDRDVILLNSDTEVYGNWLDRLREAAYRESNIATVTPLSNNAEICSYPKFIHDNWTALELPDAELDQLASIANDGASVIVPTGVGFCMYVRRACLNKIGLFDMALFGKGYGEENDLCQRAVKAGWLNILAPNVFVRHYGGASFGASKLARIALATKTIDRVHPDYLPSVGQFIQEDPVKPFRSALDIARMRRSSRKGAVLSFLHNWGGGTEEHVADMTALINESGMGSLTCKVSADDSNMLIVHATNCAELPNLPSFNVLTDLDAFAAHLAELNVRHIHVHHLAGFPEETSDFIRLLCLRLEISYDVTMHDYMAICPRIMLTDRSGVYCGEPSLSDCERCIQRDGSAFGRPSVWAWRARHSRLLQGARRVFVPNVDVERRLSRYFEQVTFVVKSHPELVDYRFTIEAPPGKLKSKHRRIALLGALGPHKGSELIEQVATAAKRMRLPLEFHIVGYTDRDEALKKIGNVYITGRYPKEDAARLLAEA